VLFVQGLVSGQQRLDVRTLLLSLQLQKHRPCDLTFKRLARFSRALTSFFLNFSFTASFLHNSSSNCSRVKVSYSAMLLRLAAWLQLHHKQQLCITHNLEVHAQDMRPCICGVRTWSCIALQNRTKRSHEDRLSDYHYRPCCNEGGEL